jgi:hypothetical protein
VKFHLLEGCKNLVFDYDLTICGVPHLEILERYTKTIYLKDPMVGKKKKTKTKETSTLF